MIDFESQIFNYIALPLRSEFNGIFITGETMSAPSKFPAVSFVEKSNTVYQKSQDSESLENHSNVMYEVNIYSNLTYDKKAQVKEILNSLDEKMQSIGFTRTFGQPIDNLENTSIYRYTVRYTAVIGKNKFVYRK